LVKGNDIIQVGAISHKFILFFKPVPMNPSALVNV
jgi:hypothetical protein